MNTQKELIRDSISDLLMENDIDLSNDMKLIGNTIYSESRIINNVDYL